MSLAVSCGFRSGADVRRDGTHPFQYGVNLSTHVGLYSHSGRAGTLRDLKRHHVGWIQLVPFAWQLDPKEPQISFRDMTSTQSEFIETVHKAGMRVMMKHLMNSGYCSIIPFLHRGSRVRKSIFLIQVTSLSCSQTGEVRLPTMDPANWFATF